MTDLELFRDPILRNNSFIYVCILTPSKEILLVFLVIQSTVVINRSRVSYTHT